jgi:hypothetical protein
MSDVGLCEVPGSIPAGGVYFSIPIWHHFPMPESIVSFWLICLMSLSILHKFKKMIKITLRSKKILVKFLMLSTFNCPKLLNAPRGIHELEPGRHLTREREQKHVHDLPDQSSMLRGVLVDRQRPLFFRGGVEVTRGGERKVWYAGGEWFGKGGFRIR